MQTSGETCREIANAYSVVIVREGGRSSIPEAAVIEPISRGVLDTRLRGDDEIALHRHLRFIGGTKRISAPLAEEWIGSSPHPCATASYCRRKGCGENEAISQRCS